MNILFLANEIRYTCGVTNHLLHLTEGLASTEDTKLFLIAGGGNGADRFKDINIDVLTDRRFLHGKRDFYNYLKAVMFLKNYLKEKNIDIIHSHSHYSANIAFVAAKNTQIQTIQTNHGILESQGRIKHFLADRYVAINEHIKEYILRKGIAREEKIKFIRCGIKVPDIPPDKEEAPLKVLAAARFTRYKGVDIFIKAVSKLSAQVRATTEFNLAGEGDLNESLRAMNTDLKTNINFLGRVTDIYRQLAPNHILVNPSISITEGFPAIISEAGANNNLLISSNFPGVHPVIQDGINGFIFAQHSVDELASKLEFFIQNYKSYKHIALNLYYKIKDEFNIDKMIEKHYNLYRECLHH